MYGTAWTREQDDEVIERIKLNNSAGKIAEELGYSRGKVMGRYRRMKEVWGVSLSKPKTYRVKRRKGKLVRVKKAPPITTPNPIDTTVSLDRTLYDSGSFHKTLLDRGTNECKWPVNDRDIDGEHLYCAHETELNQPYCAHHRARSKRKIIPNRMDRVPGGLRKSRYSQ